VALAMPSRSSAGAGPNIFLLDSSAVDIDLGEQATVAVGPERPQGHFPGRNHGSQALLGCSTARLVEFRGIYVREPNLLAVAHERVAIDCETPFAAACDERSERSN
jgi:hypothetical protein